MEKIMGDDDDVMIGSPSSEGKMVIKLKIPKLTAAMEGGERSSEVIIGSLSTSSSKAAAMTNEGKRVCSECKKEFSSGKALGGHMRIHVQAANRNTYLKPSKTTKFKKSNNQDFNHLKKKDQRKPNYMSSVNDEGKPTCSLCGKIFPSMKSLFGHMRCHPERLWRGILPPPDNATTAASRRRTSSVSVSVSASASSSSSLSENGLNVNYEEGSNILDDGVVDLTKFLRGWSVTERRGRRALKAPDEDEVLRDAVEDLMSLAHGSPAESEKQLRPPEVFEGTNSNSLTNKIDLPEKEYGKGKAVLEDEIPVAKVEFDDGGGGVIKNFSDNESDSRNTNEQMLINYKYKKNAVNNPNKIKKRKKMKLMMELEQGFSMEMVVGGGGGPTPPPPLLLTSSPQEQKYKCTTCNKTFTSHQALGGHRSSHNKSKITPTDQEDDYDSSIMNQTSDNVEKEFEFAGDANVNSSSGLHQCKICDKIFPTGQALGGHKRCHWTGTIEAQAPSSQVTSTGEAASHTGGGGRRKILDFDLNEVPPATMMEDEAGIGAGYASSSYNSNMG